MENKQPKKISLIKLALLVLLIGVICNLSGPLLKKMQHFFHGNADYHELLSLAIEKNIQSASFKKDCGLLSKDATIKTFLIPINKEIIDAAIALKCKNENLPFAKKMAITAGSYKSFLGTGKSTFVLAIINNSDQTVRFEDVKSGVKLKFENGAEFLCDEFTPSLAENLIPGYNSGYVYFKTIIPDSLNSYSVHFDKLMLFCDPKSSSPCSWAFTYNNSKIEDKNMVKYIFEIFNIQY